MNIGLIGAGHIGQFLLNAINQEDKIPGAKIVWVLDERVERTGKLRETAIQYGCQYTTSRVEFFESDIEIVLECAHPDAAKDYAMEALQHRKDILLVSAGALADEQFVEQLVERGKENNCRIYIPCGAIGGLDAIQAANVLGEIEQIELCTRKPPEAFSLDRKRISEAKIIFSGTAKEAIEKFPKNINVAVTLSLAGLGAEKTLVQILADPQVETNCHEIQVKGQFGQLKVRLDNESMPDYPKTSYLAALSALSTLQRIHHPIKLGV